MLFRSRAIIVLVTLLIFVGAVGTTYSRDVKEREAGEGKTAVKIDGFAPELIPQAQLTLQPALTRSPQLQISTISRRQVASAYRFAQSISYSQANKSRFQAYSRLEHRENETIPFNRYRIQSLLGIQKQALMAEQPHNAICTVTTTADSGSDSLRQCLLNQMSGDTITFDPQVFPPQAPATIFLLSPLPWITADNLTIDGSNAGVILSGQTLFEGAGFVVDGATGVTIQGLQIINFPWDGIALINGTTNATIGGTTSEARNTLSGNAVAGIWLEGGGTAYNRIIGNFIGTNAQGTGAFGNDAGVLILFGAKNNVVGGYTVSERNIISGNGRPGVQLEDINGDGTSNNRIIGNYIGTDVTGNAPLSNLDGVVLGFGVQHNTVGDTIPGARNLISGNIRAGVQVQNTETMHNTILGNYIGTNFDGMTAVGNNDIGMLFSEGASNNIVGGTTPETRNVISGNRDVGIQIQQVGTDSNQILGNYIGTNAAGVAALGNFRGVLIGFGAKNNVIGGGGLGEGNLISGNNDPTGIFIGAGIFIQNVATTNNRIEGNLIGTNATGSESIANDDGVGIAGGAQNNFIGGTTMGTGNVISGNFQAGVHIESDGTSNNQVLGNYIGTDVSGTASLGNNFGVAITFAAKNNMIGGATEASRNIISGNEFGLWIWGAGVSGNQVKGNYIGTDVSGEEALGNVAGVNVIEGAQNNIIGGVGEGEHNLVSGNSGVGFQIHGIGTENNIVQGNYIGTNKDGTIAVSNGHGLFVFGGAKNNTIGGSEANAGNVISGNIDIGIIFSDVGTSGNQLIGNYIGIQPDGMSALSNNVGVAIGNEADSNIVGGTVAGVGNIISGNTLVGLQLETGAMDNQVSGNYIGTDTTGMFSVANHDGLIIGLGATNNIVGGDVAGARNIISGNTNVGVGIGSEGTTNNKVWGNYIGTNRNGDGAVGNLAGVLLLEGAQNNDIGGTTPAMRNIISGNGRNGVAIQNDGTDSNRVLGNYVGVTATGEVALPNQWGIVVGFRAQGNVIGGTLPGAGNLASGNSHAGIQLQNEGTQNNVIMGNYAGTDPTGTSAIGNEDGIVILSGAQDNVVGGETEGARNLASGNQVGGITLDGAATSNNHILGNAIGTDASGMNVIGNEHGIVLQGNANHNRIGGDTPAAGNLIRGSRQFGIYLAGTEDNFIGHHNVIVDNVMGGVGIQSLNGQPVLGNTISQNSIYDNGCCNISFLDADAPVPISQPIINFDAQNNRLSGTVFCPQCIIEIFGNVSEQPAGVVYLGTAIADGNSNFTFTHEDLSAQPCLALTLTDLDGTTSEFVQPSEQSSCPLEPNWTNFLPVIMNK